MMTVSRVMNSSSNVRIDDFHASREMTEYLIATGHTRIAFIRGHPNQTASALRYDGFRAAMTTARLTVEPALIQQGYFTYRSDLEATGKLLARKNPSGRSCPPSDSR
jgi:LacI family transcriptional regulator